MPLQAVQQPPHGGLGALDKSGLRVGSWVPPAMGLCVADPVVRGPVALSFGVPCVKWGDHSTPSTLFSVCQAKAAVGRGTQQGQRTQTSLQK